MKPDVDTIINELYEIDPTLKERGADIRILVTTLLEARPDVVISENFLTSLRARLLERTLHTSPKPVPQTTPNFAWWALRLAPIGAFALLLLMLIPQPANSPTAPVYQGDTYKTSAPTMETMNQFDRTASKTNMSAPAPMSMSVEHIQNPIVQSVVTLERPGFIVVRVVTNSGQYEIVGVSKFLNSGTTVGVQINLLRPVSMSESIEAGPYADNGDGVFTEEDTRLP